MTKQANQVLPNPRCAKLDKLEDTLQQVTEQLNEVLPLNEGVLLVADLATLPETADVIRKLNALAVKPKDFWQETVDSREMAKEAPPSMCSRLELNT